MISGPLSTLPPSPAMPTSARCFSARTLMSTGRKGIDHGPYGGYVVWHRLDWKWPFFQQNQSWLDTLALCGLQGLQRVDQGACHQTQRCHRRHQHGKDLVADIFICDQAQCSLHRCHQYIKKDIYFCWCFPLSNIFCWYFPLSNICCHLLDVWILFLTVYCYPHSVTRTERAVMQKKEKYVWDKCCQLLLATYMCREKRQIRNCSTVKASELWKLEESNVTTVSPRQV